MTQSACSSLARLLGAHVDGQLDAARTLEVDDHLASCESCRERVALDRAIRGSLKKATKIGAPSDVKARMLATMAAQTAREEAASEAEELALESTPAAPERGMLRHWRTMLPLASAAALTLAWGIAGKQPVTSGSLDVMEGGPGFALRDLVNVHKHPIHPETPDPKEVRAFEREVGVPVRVPRFKQNAKFVGGRVLNVQGAERAAMLQYEVPQTNGGVQRVSVFIYDPARVHIVGAGLAPRAVGTAQVHVGQAGGYSVAVAQHQGVGYAVASDLDPDSSAQLVAAAEAE